MFDRRMGFSSESFFVVADEEAYAQAFRDARWSEPAIQQELELLRKFKAGHPHLYQPPPPQPDPIADEDDDMAQILARARARRTQQS